MTYYSLIGSFVPYTNINQGSGKTKKCMAPLVNFCFVLFFYIIYSLTGDLFENIQFNGHLVLSLGEYPQSSCL